MVRFPFPLLPSHPKSHFVVFLSRLPETFLSSNSVSTSLANSPEADSSTAALNRQRKTIEASPFAPAARKALEELYSNEFGRFVRTKIVSFEGRRRDELE